MGKRGRKPKKQDELETLTAKRQTENTVAIRLNLVELGKKSVSRSCYRCARLVKQYYESSGRTLRLCKYCLQEERENASESEKEESAEVAT